MLEVIAEIIGEFLFAFFCRYPGAFIRWVIFRKKTFSEYLDSDWFVNVFPVVLILTLIVIIYTIFK